MDDDLAALQDQRIESDHLASSTKSSHQIILLYFVGRSGGFQCEQTSTFLFLSQYCCTSHFHFVGSTSNDVEIPNQPRAAL